MFILQGRTLITSMLLNLRSCLMTYHPIINALTLWDNRALKRLLQAFNQYGFLVSYSFLLRAVVHLSKDAVHLASSVANDHTKVKLFPYDNFNWMA